MPASTLALLAYASLLSLLLPFISVSCRHVTCEWQIGKGVPSKYGYDLFCTASVTNKSTNAADYRCPDNEELKGVKVADFGRLAPGILEFGTPCAGAGYGRDYRGNCRGSHWALCLGDNKKGDCLFMSSADDCQWPKLFRLAELPNTVTIWFHKYAAAAGEFVEGILTSLAA